MSVLFKTQRRPKANTQQQLRAELSGNYVKRVEDVSPKRSQEQIDAKLRELLAGGYPAEAGRPAGGAQSLQVRSQARESLIAFTEYIPLFLRETSMDGD